VAEESTQVTMLLQAVARGETGAVDQLLPLVYDELRRVAAGLMRHERKDHTLQPTALVHEAYLRLVGPREIPWKDRGHFFHAAALSMRRILIDHARRVRAARAAGGPATGEFSGDSAGLIRTEVGGGNSADATERLLALDQALERLKARDERQHDVAMLRYFAGLTIDQTAEVLGVSPATVKNEWMYARAWLMREMASKGLEPGSG
jgi:RNA polymerase sigma factor (TIGR02999 family)